MAEQRFWTKTAASIRRTLSENPKPSSYGPVTDAIQKAAQLGEQAIGGSLKNFGSMPQSTMVFANPVLFQAPVDCDGSETDIEYTQFRHSRRPSGRRNCRREH